MIARSKQQSNYLGPWWPLDIKKIVCHIQKQSSCPKLISLSFSVLLKANIEIIG